MMEGRGIKGEEEELELSTRCEQGAGASRGAGARNGADMRRGEG